MTCIVCAAYVCYKAHSSSLVGFRTCFTTKGSDCHMDKKPYKKPFWKEGEDWR